jgi:pimeloyl-ACP methyl ester carboxylesterase
MSPGNGANHSLEHAGARLHWRFDAGNVSYGGPPLVLIHGWALSLDYWDPVASHLALRRGLLRYDRRGFGATQGPYDPTLACDDLLALLDAAGIGRACLVGMSQGARVAIHTAIRAPQRVAGLVLDGAPWFEAETELPLAEYRRLLEKEGLASLHTAILAHPLMRLATPDVQRQNLLARCVRSYRGADLKDGWAQMPTPDLGAIGQPTLVLNGSDDGAQRREAGVRLCEAIDGARQVNIDGAAHLAALDQPLAWAAAVLEFVASK